MDLLTAPYYALFNLDFYRSVIASPLRKGFLYLLYLSTIVVILFSGYFALTVMPKIDAFAEWIEKELPPLTWTPEGLVMDAPSPHAMVHPEYGMLAVLDMSRGEITEDEMGEAAVFVTATHLYMRDGEGGIRIHALTRSSAKLKPDQLAVPIDGELIRSNYQKFRLWIYVLPALFSFPLVFLTKLGEVVLLSLPGYLLNRTRREPLDYTSVFRVTCFAVTAATLLEVRWLVPGLAHIPFGFIGSAIVTFGYLFFALKKTETFPPFQA